MRLQFCGAAREVTGSTHLLTLDNGFKILLDCGLYQGDSADMESFNRNWYFKPEEIDCLVLSHAHIDHSGRIPRIYVKGFKGEVITTKATADLCSIMLPDCGHIQEFENEWTNIDLVNRRCEIVAEKVGKERNYFKKLITFVKDRPGHDRRYAINCDKIKKELGWKQSVSFDEGLSKTVDWYLSNSEWIEEVKSGEYRKWIERNYGGR